MEFLINQTMVIYYLIVCILSTTIAFVKECDEVGTKEVRESVDGNSSVLLTSQIPKAALKFTVEIIEVQSRIINKAGDLPSSPVRFLGSGTYGPGVTWQLPYKIQDEEFDITNKWICLANAKASLVKALLQERDNVFVPVHVFISSDGEESQEVGVRIGGLETHSLMMKVNHGAAKRLRSSATKPALLIVDFESAGCQRCRLRLQAKTEDLSKEAKMENLCALVVVQTHACPFPEEFDVSERSVRLSFTKKATLILDRRDLGVDTVYVSILVLPHNDFCGTPDGSRTSTEQKRMRAVLENVEAMGLGAVLFGAPLLLFLPVIFLILCRSFRSKPAESLEQPVVESEGIAPTREEDGSAEVPERLMDLVSEDGAEGAPEGVLVQLSDSPSLPVQGEGDVCPGSGSCTDESMLRPSSVTVSDCVHDQLGESGDGDRLVSIKDLDADSSSYWWLQALVMLYGLPPIIVLAWNNFLVGSKDFDLCYHNFECCFSIGPIPCVNSFISNYGFILVGLVIFLTPRLVLTGAVLKPPPLANSRGVRRGVPRQEGLEMALGLSVVCVGVSSALYHLCPNSAGVRWDVAAVFGAVSLLQFHLFAFRHGPTRPLVAFTITGIGYAVVILGSAQPGHDVVAWLFLVLMEVLVKPLISLQIYYDGHIDFNLFAVGAAFRSLRLVVWQEIRHGHIAPLFAHRLVLLACSNLISLIATLAVAISGKIDLPSYLISWIVFNLVSYLLYYVFNKIRCGETLSKGTRLWATGALCLWLGALICFYQTAYDWNMSPAASRALNRPCQLGIYDLHDVWHFFAAAALLLSWQTLRSMDRELDAVDRDKISIF